MSCHSERNVLNIATSAWPHPPEQWKSRLADGSARAVVIVKGEAKSLKEIVLSAELFQSKRLVGDHFPQFLKPTGLVSGLEFAARKVGLLRFVSVKQG
jgi:hypothetical protein